jgi:membrane protease YdiL (CAAX protease family)
MSPPPFPGPLQASLLALLGIFLANLAAAALAGAPTPTAALGFACVLGLGAAGALGAAHVPPPHAERLGLRGLGARQAAAVLLLVPVGLLASEIGHLLAIWLPPPDAEQLAQRVQEVLPTGGGLALAETALVAIGLVPLFEEWLFRGVIQQGLVATAGARAGVVLTALLFALGHSGVGVSAPSWVAALLEGFALGLAFGYARHVTGSLLAAVLLHAGVNALGVSALALADTVPIPGYNAAGAHLPLPLLAAAAVSTVLGLLLLPRSAN